MRHVRVPETVLDVLRDQIVVVVGRYVDLKPAGAGAFKGLCPFRAEKTPSFYVHRPKKIAHCFGCGINEDVFGFLQRIEHISFPEAIRLAGSIVGIPTDGEDAPALEIRRQRLIGRGMAIWRETQIQRHAEDLRERDRLVGIARQLAEYCSENNIDDAVRDEACMPFLEEAYAIGRKGYSLTEYDFHRLLDSNISTTQLHREIDPL
jgi:DNA primase